MSIVALLHSEEDFEEPRELSVLSAGSYFGEIPFVVPETDLQPMEGRVSSEVSNMYSLSEVHVKTLFNSFPEAHEVMRTVARERLKKFRISSRRRSSLTREEENTRSKRANTIETLSRMQSVNMRSWLSAASEEAGDDENAHEDAEIVTDAMVEMEKKLERGIITKEEYDQMVRVNKQATTSLSVDDERASEDVVPGPKKVDSQTASRRRQSLALMAPAQAGSSSSKGMVEDLVNGTSKKATTVL